MARTDARDKNTTGICLADQAFCAIDLETTGLSSFSRIVELGAVRFKIGEEGETLQTLVDPCCAIPKGAMRVHGITDEMVEGAPQAPEILRQLIEFSEGCVLVAHNARYDTSILSTELARAEIEMPPNDVVCTIRAAKHFLPKMRNYRLQTLTQVLEIDPGDAHRALSDAISAKLVLERAVTIGPSWQETSVSYLLEHCSSARLGASVDVEARVPEEMEEIRIAIDDAIDSGASMMLMYKSGGKPPWPMQVRPICVMSVRGGHYLEAACGDGYTRSFRLDRIERIVTLDFEG